MIITNLNMWCKF